MHNFSVVWQTLIILWYGCHKTFVLNIAESINFGLWIHKSMVENHLKQNIVLKWNYFTELSSTDTVQWKRFTWEGRNLILSKPFRWFSIQTFWAACFWYHAGNCLVDSFVVWNNEVSLQIFIAKTCKEGVTKICVLISVIFESCGDKSSWSLSL